MHAQMPSSGMGLTSPSYPSRMYPDNRLFGQYGQYGNTLKGGLGFGSNVYNSRNNGRWGVVDTKYKPTPCLLQNSKFQNYHIERESYMHRVLNLDEIKNKLHSLFVNCETNLEPN